MRAISLYGYDIDTSAPVANVLLDCKCGNSAEVWLDKGWAHTGCKRCGKAAAAFKNFSQSGKDWNKIANK